MTGPSDVGAESARRPLKPGITACKELRTHKFGDSCSVEENCSERHNITATDKPPPAVDGPRNSGNMNIRIGL